MLFAGISMGRGRGFGRAKVQERAARKDFRIKKESTERMLADVLTKPVIQDQIRMAMKNHEEHEPYVCLGGTELTLRAGRLEPRCTSFCAGRR